MPSIITIVISVGVGAALYIFYISIKWVRKMHIKLVNNVPKNLQYWSMTEITNGASIEKDH